MFGFSSMLTARLHAGADHDRCLAPKMLKLAGELTDGTITIGPTSAVGEHIVPAITAAARGAAAAAGRGRPPGGGLRRRRRRT
jgi:hypothetical protein